MQGLERVYCDPEFNCSLYVELQDSLCFGRESNPVLPSTALPICEVELIVNSLPRCLTFGGTKRQWQCTHICMYVCMYACICVYMYICNVCMYVCMYICMYVCMYIVRSRVQKFPA